MFRWVVLPLQSLSRPVTDCCVCVSCPLRSVLQTLALNKAQAQSVCRVLESVQQGLLSLGKPHLFQAPCILFLQELLACQKDFNGY